VRLANAQYKANVPGDLHLITSNDVTISGATTMGTLHLEGGGKLHLLGQEDKVFKFNNVELDGAVDTNANIEITNIFKWISGQFAAVDIPTGTAKVRLPLYISINQYRSQICLAILEYQNCTNCCCYIGEK